MDGSTDPPDWPSGVTRRGHPYWLNTTEAAEVLGVSPTRVRQLARRGSLPVEMHEGHRYFRRAQLEVVANAREARRLK